MSLGCSGVGSVNLPSTVSGTLILGYFPCATANLWLNVTLLLAVFGARRSPASSKVYVPGAVSRPMPARANHVLVDLSKLKVTWWPTHVPVSDSRRAGGLTLNNIRGPVIKLGRLSATV